MGFQLSGEAAINGFGEIVGTGLHNRVERGVSAQAALALVLSATAS